MELRLNKSKVKVYTIAYVMLYLTVCDGVENISREQFESLQKDVASLQKELNYWQNTTINILKKYLLENEGNCCIKYTS